MLTNANIEVVLLILFLSFNNANFGFDVKKLSGRSYTITKALPITSWVELNDKREFGKVVLDEELKTFVIHMAKLKAELVDSFFLNGSNSYIEMG